MSTEIIKYDFGTSAFSDIQDINSSFAKGRLKVMYLGKNRNNTFFSKEAVQKALPSLKNVPVVSHWIYEEEIIGGHDVDIVKDHEGNLRMRNVTEPCGVVPDHARFSFVTEYDENGDEHEYLAIDGVILWKRQDVFRHIQNDLCGNVDHSMEINVINTRPINDGVIDITDFEFTALCLLERDAPCFQGSELTLYSTNNAEAFKFKLNEMFEELAKYTPVDTSVEVDNNKLSVEGGEQILEEKIQLITSYGLNVEDFDIESMDIEELQAKLDEYSTKSEAEPVADEDDIPEAEETPEVEISEDTQPESKEFALESNVKIELVRSLEKEKIECEWGPVSRYYFTDYDCSASEVYAIDSQDWLLYGFKYSMDGDNPIIDFESKSRKKFAIVDFDNGSQENLFADVYNLMNSKIKSMSVAYSELSDTVDSLKTAAAAIEAEITELRQYKLDAETEKKNIAKANVLSMFTELQGEPAFETLVAESDKYDLETLEEKCYALKGRLSVGKYSIETKLPKIKIDKTESQKNEDVVVEPYGGIVQKYNN